MIKDDKLQGVEFIPSPNISGEITPKFVVMHYTAGYNADSAIATFKNPRTKVSAHLIIDRDGRTVQMVPFNRAAWHAGPSAYDGFKMLNNNSIGIEIVNIGWVKKTADGSYLDPYGHTVAPSKIGKVVEAPNSRVGSGMLYWPVYTDAQLDAVERITKDLIDTYPIRDIVSHEEIDTRRWKTDPGPAFPMQRFKSLLAGGRADPAKEHATVNVASLNVRSGPGPEWKVFGELSRNSAVEILDRKGDWRFVKFDAGNGAGLKEGWVHGSYLTPE